ncbi:hypothetical protein ACFQ36_15630 [Arthrobacter sp. GCM10027362]|uniref:hypothetical protein n=1 Tax=Arthrobacter sp. GCM10027362 TaxID=3273379 RepID=UPI00362D1968
MPRRLNHRACGCVFTSVDYQLDGLPLHVLLVHATVVVVPLAALCTVLSLLWPAARRRLGAATPLVALAALVLVPLTQEAGEWLMARVDTTPQLQAHVGLGLKLLPWVAGLFAAALAQWLWFRYGTGPERRLRTALGVGGTRVLAVVVMAGVVALAAGTTVAVVRVGESGSRAVWEGRFSQEPVLP